MSKVIFMIFALCAGSMVFGVPEEGKIESMAMDVVCDGAPKALCSKYWWQAPEKVKELVEKMDRAGIKVIIPCAYSHGLYFFKSSHALYNKRIVADMVGYDPLELLIVEAKKKNIKVIPFFPSVAAAGQEACLKASSGGDIPHQDWFNMDMYGNTRNGSSFSYDPANPEFRAYFVSLVEDLLKYDIDGLQLDYIRYVGPQWGYTPKARELFMKEHGVDPLTLVTNPEKIDPVTLYCLKPLSWQKKDWILSNLIMLLGKTGVNYKIVEETESGIPQIPDGSIVLLASCYDLNSKTIAQLNGMLDKGGDLIFIDGPTSAVKKHEKELGPILGVSGEHQFFHDNESVITPAGKHPITGNSSNLTLKCSGNSFLKKAVTTGQVIATFDENRPAIILNKFKNGNVILFNYQMLMADSGNYGDSKFLKNAVDWLSSTKRLSLYFYQPQDISSRYAWIPAITRTFFNSAKISPRLVGDLDSLKALADLDKEQIRKTSLICTSYFDPGKDAMGLLKKYAEKGGNLMIFLDKDLNIKDMDTGWNLIARYPEFFNSTPMGSAVRFDAHKDVCGHDYSILKLQNSGTSETLLKNIPDEYTDFYGAPFAGADEANVVVRMTNSVPALFHFKSEDGNIWIFNYGLQSTGRIPGILLNNLVKNIAKDNGVEYLSDKVSKLMDTWDKWRCAQVTELVKMVKETIKKNKSGIPLSAAVVDSYYPEKVVFQDWKHWINSGYVDMVYPMDYFDDDANLVRMLDWLRKDVDADRQSRIYPLLKLYAKGANNKVSRSVTPEELRRQIEIVKNKGYRNIGFFADCYLDDALVEELKKDAK